MFSSILNLFSSPAQQALHFVPSWLPAPGWYAGIAALLGLAFAGVVLFLKDIRLAVELGIAAAFASFLGVAAVGYENMGENKIIPQLNAANAQIAAAEQRQQEMQTRFDAQTKQYEGTLAAKQAKIDSTQKQLAQEIKTNAQLTRVVIPDLARRLFNASVEGKSHVEVPAPDAKQGDDGKTGADQGAAVAGPQVTLADLLSVVAENNANHRACIAQVEEWQRFWTDFVATVNESIE